MNVGPPRPNRIERPKQIWFQERLSGVLQLYRVSTKRSFYDAANPNCINQERQAKNVSPILLKLNAILCELEAYSLNDQQIWLAL